VSVDQISYKTVKSASYAQLELSSSHVNLAGEEESLEAITI
jgi:hypothetical protein